MLPPCARAHVAFAQCKVGRASERALGRGGADSVLGLLPRIALSPLPPPAYRGGTLLLGGSIGQPVGS